MEEEEKEIGLPNEIWERVLLELSGAELWALESSGVGLFRRLVPQHCRRRPSLLLFDDVSGQGRPESVLSWRLARLSHCSVLHLRLRRDSQPPSSSAFNKRKVSWDALKSGRLSHLVETTLCP